MKKYEAVFILDEQKYDDAGEAFVKELEGQIVAMGGVAESHQSLGRRQLAAPIRKKFTGIYWIFIFTLAEAQVKPLQDLYHLNLSVLRYQVFIHDRPEKIRIEWRRGGQQAPSLTLPEEAMKD